MAEKRTFLNWVDTQQTKIKNSLAWEFFIYQLCGHMCGHKKGGKASLFMSSNYLNR